MDEVHIGLIAFLFWLAYRLRDRLPRIQEGFRQVTSGEKGLTHVSVALASAIGYLLAAVLAYGLLASEVADEVFSKQMPLCMDVLALQH